MPSAWKPRKKNAQQDSRIIAEIREEMDAG